MDGYVRNDMCNKEHESVNKQLTHHENWLNEHENKIDTLTAASIANTKDIQNVCKQMGRLTTSIWGLVTIAAGGLISLMVWYIETK